MGNKMRPFNLARALAGDPVITREGRKIAGKIAHFPHAGGNQKVAFTVEGESSLHTCNEEGDWGNVYPSRNDLFMAPKEITLWLNLYVSPAGVFYVNSYPTESQANANAGLGREGYARSYTFTE